MKRFLGLIVLFTACSTAPTPVSSGWLSQKTLESNNYSLTESVQYSSGGLKVGGIICRPKSASNLPAIVLAHGDFDGIDTNTKELCQNLSLAGYAVFAPEYRGEGTSEGTVEMCLGEVDDTTIMYNIARTQSYVNPSRMGLIGVSHGGCVALRAMQKGLNPKAVVSLFAPYDAINAYNYIYSSLKITPNPVLQKWLSLTEKATGGTPLSRLEEYQKRSVTYYLKDLENNQSGSLLLIHGLNDNVVSYEQSCDLAAHISNLTTYVYQSTGALMTTAPKGCPLTLQTTNNNNWSNDNYLLLYDGLGHGDGTVMTNVVKDIQSFLQHKL